MPIMTCKKCDTFGDCSGDVCPLCGAVMEAVPEPASEIVPEVKEKTVKHKGKKVDLY